MFHEFVSLKFFSYIPLSKVKGQTCNMHVDVIRDHIVEHFRHYYYVTLHFAKQLISTLIAKQFKGTKVKTRFRRDEAAGCIGRQRNFIFPSLIYSEFLLGRNLTRQLTVQYVPFVCLGGEGRGGEKKARRLKARPRARLRSYRISGARFRLRAGIIIICQTRN